MKTEQSNQDVGNFLRFWLVTCKRIFSNSSAKVFIMNVCKCWNASTKLRLRCPPPGGNNEGFGKKD
eukprot:5955455-Amphidinium_carterae.1